MRRIKLDHFARGGAERRLQGEFAADLRAEIIRHKPGGDAFTGGDGLPHFSIDA